MMPKEIYISLRLSSDSQVDASKKVLRDTLLLEHIL